MGLVMDEANIAKEVTAPGLEIAYRGAAANVVRMIMNHNDYEVEYNGQTIAPYESRIEIV